MRSRNSEERLANYSSDWDSESLRNSGYDNWDSYSLRSSHDLPVSSSFSSSSISERERPDRAIPAMQGVPPPLSEWSLSTSLYKSSTANGNSRRRSRSGSGGGSGSSSARGEVQQISKEVAIILPDEET